MTPPTQKRDGDTVKKYLKYGFAVLLALLVVVFILHCSGNIGMSQRGMEQEVRDWKKLEYGFVGDIRQSMAVFLQYKEDKTEYDICIYAKRPRSIGWFFRYGGATSSISGPCDGLYQMNLENNGEYVLFGMNTTPVEWIEIEMAPDSQRIISLVDGRPFAYVMDRAWEVTVYGPGGVVLQPVEREF